jgi:hypothetical protein
VAVAGWPGRRALGGRTGRSSPRRRRGRAGAVASGSGRVGAVEQWQVAAAARWPGRQALGGKAVVWRGTKREDSTWTRSGWVNPEPDPVKC